MRFFIFFNLFLTLFLMVTSPSFGDYYYVPYTGNSASPTKVTVINKSQLPQYLNVLYYSSESKGFDTVSLKVAASQEAHFLLHEHTDDNKWALITTNDQSLKILSDKHLPLPFEGATGYKIENHLDVKKFFLANPTGLKNQIDFYNEQNEIVKTLELAPYQSLLINMDKPLNKPDQTKFYPHLIKARHRFFVSTSMSAYANEKNLWQWHHPHLPESLSPPKNTHYFLMGRRGSFNSNETFVIPISDPELVQKARDLIKKPEIAYKKVIAAQIELGHGQFNRSFGSNLGAAWSWHVSKVIGFSDFASQQCDGSPILIEVETEKWLYEIGQICFWNFTILREISPSEI